MSHFCVKIFAFTLHGSADDHPINDDDDIFIRARLRAPLEVCCRALARGNSVRYVFKCVFVVLL